MSNDNNPLRINQENNQEQDLDSSIQNQSQASPQIQSERQRETNVQMIRTREITGPLVILFGPRKIGKTVTLLRLDRYLRSKYEVEIDQNFWENNDEYLETVRDFQNLRENGHFAPNATGAIDFLLLNVNEVSGGRFCQILEAPGEHFFDKDEPQRAYPFYMNQIIAADYQKIFIFFFELNMFNSDQIFQDYVNKIAQLISQRISSRRDRIILLCNKCDEYSYFKDKKPIKKEFQNRIYKHSAFKKLEETISKSNFKYIPFVPFSAGTFNETGSPISGQEKAFVDSPVDFPKSLWAEIYNCINPSWTDIFRF